MPRMDSEAAAIAVTRFGLGGKPGEIAAVAQDPRGWLTAQITPGGAPVPPGPLPTTLDQIAALRTHSRVVRQARARIAAMAIAAEAAMEDGAAARPDASPESRQALARSTADEFLARTRLGTATEAGFAERWALFWINVFTASATKFQTGVFIGPYEREAIRPHVFGRFEDLAVAAETHPAMLMYLDQSASVGPNSVAGRRRQSGLNENLAREIMELHTVGTDGGYSQADVTEFARAMTGWSVAAEAPAGSAAAGSGGFVFRAAAHEPGPRTVMGRRYDGDSHTLGERILRDLANQPATARRLARRIAVHFVADDPPESLVARLQTAWLDSAGDLGRVAGALVAAPEAWSPQAAKVKTPYEFIVSAHRALGAQPQTLAPVRQALLQMGQPMFQPPSPEGWPETAEDWAGPHALVTRLTWARAMSDLSADAEPVAVATSALGARLQDRTREFMMRAESRAEAMTLFLMSPEFQRR
ncbi:MAG: DUF1800 domain-containing protein [Brevundimonas sp.]